MLHIQTYYNSNFLLLKYASNVPCFLQVCAALYTSVVVAERLNPVISKLFILNKIMPNVWHIDVWVVHTLHGHGNIVMKGDINNVESTRNMNM